AVQAACTCSASGRSSLIVTWSRAWGVATRVWRTSSGTDRWPSGSTSPMYLITLCMAAFLRDSVVHLISLALALQLLHLRQRRLRLGQPEGHVHRPIQRHGSRQLGAGLLLLPVPDV